MNEKRRKRKTEKLRKEFASIRTDFDKLGEQSGDECESKYNWREFTKTLKRLSVAVAKLGDAIHDMKRRQQRRQRKMRDLEAEMQRMSKQYG